jgi:peptidoglycan hydrolase-like protein with peptidoglycan-binding domain
MTMLRRCLLPLTLAAMCLVLTAPATAAKAAPSFPTQSAGNRGTDVKAIQWLLSERGYPVTVDGIFGATTADAVMTYQTAIGLPANGIVDDATWTKLVVRLSLGSSGPAVSAVQRELHAKRHLVPPVNGVFGASTRTAVRAFQKHEGLTVTGVVNRTTWRWLIWHFELPTFNTTSLCDYSVGNGTANWATSAATNQLEAAARVVAGQGHGRVAVGDASRQHGGDIAGHVTHERGLDIDVRLMRKGKDQCRWGGNWRAATYDRAATRALIVAIRATAPGHVKLIYFNDPVLIKAGLTTRHAGHDDHLHIRYCEKTYPLKAYAC